MENRNPPQPQESNKSPHKAITTQQIQGKNAGVYNTQSKMCIRAAEAV